MDITNMYVQNVPNQNWVTISIGDDVFEIPPKVVGNNEQMLEEDEAIKFANYLLSEKNIREQLKKYEYIRNRVIEYPPISEFADAMYWATKGDNTKLDAYYAACEAVKAKYPKVE